MAIKLSTTLRTARMGVVETTVGTSAKLKLFTGAAPANPAAADSGTLLATLDLPSDWLAAASAGAVGKTGTWEGVGASGASTGTAAGHFRLYASDGTTCHIQGTVTATGGGGDMTVDNNSIAEDQVVRVTSFTLTDGNA